MNSARSLSSWLEYIECVHPRAVAMGIERAEKVRQSLRLVPRFPIITVGGTNGKGSVCALSEAILSAGGYRVGLYTSPHLIAVNERIRVGGADASDDEICAALAQVEMGRGQVPLTYFEYLTLAAMVLFCQRDVDIAILEVGMGGRLDAVNIFHPDVAIISSIDVDHQEFLGASRSSVAIEKSGIFRRGRAAVCGDQSPPDALVDRAKEIGARLVLAGRDFGRVQRDSDWDFWSADHIWTGLPLPRLTGAFQLDNASSCLAALAMLRDVRPVARAAIERGLRDVFLPGRFELVARRPEVILDVAHNPHGAKALAASLASLSCDGCTVAVFGMMVNKDITGVIAQLAETMSAWMVCDLDSPRAARAQLLQEELERQGIATGVSRYGSAGEAYTEACRVAGEAGRVVVFGSFVTVAEVMKVRARSTASIRDPITGSI